MAFDPTPYLEQILLQVGDPNSTIEDLLPTSWERYYALTGKDVELTALYVKRSMLEVRLAEEVESTDIAIGQDWTDKQSERFDHVKMMFDATSLELTTLLEQRRLTGSAVIGGLGSAAHGVLARTTLADPLWPHGFNANDPRYRGDPYRRTRRPR